MVSFNGSNGIFPYGSLIADANGDLFGTTENGGAYGYGTIFEIVNNGALSAPNYASAPTTVVSFNGSNGAYPYGSLIADASGDLFATTEGGGAYGLGAVFEITNSGFVVGAPTIAITTPIADDNVVNKAEAAAGFAISGSETDADGQTVTVKVVNSSSQVIDTLTTTAASGAWSVNVTSAEAQALANGSYTVKADVSNVGGTPATEATQTITVDETTPTVSVGVSSADVNLANDTATVTFSFSAAPAAFSLSDATAVGGTLSNLQQVNATQYTATFTAASNTDISNAVVGVTASSYQDAYGNPGAAGASSDFVVDTVTPTVSVGVSSADVNLANDTSTVTFAFSEAPASFSLSDATAVGGTLSNLQQVNPAQYTATFTAASNTDVSNATVGVTANSYQDANGNPGAAGASSAFVVDTVTPTVAVGLSSADVNIARNTATVTFAFSAAPAAFSLSDATAVGGTLTNLQQVNPSEYTATFTAASNTDMSNATVGVTANSYQDANGNPGAAGASSDFVVDTVTPTVSVGVSSTDVNIAHNTATATFTFSEAPTAFSLSDVTAVGGKLSALTEVNATTYTATFTGAVNTDINDAAVSVTAGSWQEVNGNSGAAGASSDFVVDTVTPTVSVGLSSKDVNIAHNTATVTFAFSEAPTAFSLSDVTAVGGTLSALTEVNATSYTATFTGALNTDINDAAVSVTAGSWQEVNGNSGAAGASSDFVVDTVTPTVSVDLSRKDLTLAHDTATVTFAFSEAPTAFSLSDVTALGGTLSALTEVNPTTYTATFTGAVNTDIDSAVVSVTAGSWEEINGNAGAAGGSAAFTVNTMDYWIKSSSANWSTAADWRNGVPTAKVGADVDASGTYEVTISSAVAAYGLTLNDPGATITDNSGGTLTLDGTGGSSSPNGVLNIDAGTFVLNGGGLRAGLISIASGGEALVSAGAETGSSVSQAIVDNGSLTYSDVSPVIVSRSISGSGSIVVNEGSVTFNGAITGSETVTVENTADAIFNTPIAGTGSFVVRNAGRLEFGAADSENVRFAAGATGTLKIDHSLTAPFTGTIAGLTKNDSVDLADLTLVKGHMHATFSGNTRGGVLTVSDGSHSVELDLSGNYTTSTWALSKDGAGGTTVTDPPAHNSDDYDLLVGPVGGTGEYNLSGRSTPEFGAGVSSGQTLTFGAGAHELIGSAYAFDGMVDDYFANGDAAIANAFAESATALLYPQAGADGLTRTLTDGANSAVLNLAGEPNAQSDFSIMSAHNGAGLAIKFV